MINKKLSYLGLARYNNLSNQTKIKNIALGGINTNNIKPSKNLFDDGKTLFKNFFSWLRVYKKT